MNPNVENPTFLDIAFDNENQEKKYDSSKAYFDMIQKEVFGGCTMYEIQKALKSVYPEKFV